MGCGLLVVGPEAPVVAGLANDLVKVGIPTFGPSAEAAALEGSKNFMKSLCDKYGIPTAKYQTFTDPSPAPVLRRELQSVVMESIILPTVKGMAAEGCRFVGVLYAGLMIEKKSGSPELIEYNVRFGDPECQLMPIS